MGLTYEWHSVSELTLVYPQSIRVKQCKGGGVGGNCGQNICDHVVFNLGGGGGGGGNCGQNICDHVVFNLICNMTML